MDLVKVLAQLRLELANLDAAIASLERLKTEGPPRRGRPPKSLAAARKIQEQEAEKTGTDSPPVHRRKHE